MRKNLLNIVQRTENISENEMNLVTAFASIIDWFIEKDRRVRYLTEITHPEKQVYENYFPDFDTHKDADKYKYCYGDNELKKEVDDIEEWLKREGLLLNTFVLRQIFIFCKNGLSGTFTIFVDNEKLVKFELSCTDNQFSMKGHKEPNMQELIDRVK